MNLKSVNKDNLFYSEPQIKTDLNKTVNIVFADWAASGRQSPLIDHIISTRVLPYYSNTHSNASCGIMMKDKIDKTKKYIRKVYNLQNRHKIIFTGCGATGAINHLARSINTTLFKKITVLISSFEHHSNYLPWREICKENPNNTQLLIIPIKNDSIDYEWLDHQLAELNKDSSQILNIISITGCSNVTGIITDIDLFKNIINRYNTNSKRNYLLIDNACLAPYKKIDLSNIDGTFISPHKFIGGNSTPGLLIADRSLFTSTHSFCPGGGCVKKADGKNVVYYDDIEKRESAGTPNIVGIIRTKYVLMLQQKFIDTIEHNEHIITLYVHNKLEDLSKKYKNFRHIYPKSNIDNRLPIVSLFIDDLHYNFVVILLNDLFGIQSRGGISCCGMFGQTIKEKYGVDGWCRITFNWTMTKEEIDYILKAIEEITTSGKSYMKYYKYDKTKNLYVFDK